jgi:hypothetical protein
MSAHTRTYSLPHGYSVEFGHSSSTPFEVRWSPDVPRIRKPGQQRKFFAAYQAARREFLEEVAAVRGGNILVIDTLPQGAAAEVVRVPVQH